VHCALLLLLLLQLRPALAEAVLQRTKLLKWLLSRIKVKGSDSNKQYASEVLSILMQVRGHTGL
jgi:beta-catenin-like protein 1